MIEDSGVADARLVAALAGVDHAEVLAALVDARVFAAITATATGTETGAHGLRQESSAEMAVVLLEDADGSRALPVFTDLGQLKRWRLDVRPVPLTGPQACQAALDERADALVLDPAGTAVAVTELGQLAQGFVPVLGSALSARHAETPLRGPTAVPDGLVDALREALRGEPLRAVRLLESQDGLVVGVVPSLDLGPADLAALAQRLVAALGPAMPPGGLDLAVVAPSGPGVDLLTDPPQPRRLFRRR